MSPEPDASHVRSAPARAAPRATRGRTKWWRSRAFDVVQFLGLSGGLVWLTVRGAEAMGYNWQ